MLKEKRKDESTPVGIMTGASGTEAAPGCGHMAHVMMLGLRAVLETVAPGMSCGECCIPVGRHLVPLHAALPPRIFNTPRNYA